MSKKKSIEENYLLEEKLFKLISVPANKTVLVKIEFDSSLFQFHFNRITVKLDSILIFEDIGYKVRCINFELEINIGI